MNEIINLLNPWWFSKNFETGIEREEYLNKLIKSLKHKRVTLLVGSRRVGKTTIFFQMIKKLLKRKVNPHCIFYVLADHPQISSYKIFDLLRQYRKTFNLSRKTKIYLFLDEVQYIKKWEEEVKALADTENIKIFLSGSATSILLIKSSYLTGRIEKINLYPLSFKEFLHFNNAKISETEEYKYEKYLEEYLKVGGYPEYVLEKNPSYFADLVNNILYKDIVNFYQLKNPDLLKDLILLLSERVGCQTTYAKLASILSIKVDTVKEYIFYLKNTFIIDELPRYAKSRSSRIYGPKKFYFLDNGILFHLLGKVSYSAAFEQTIFNWSKTRFENLGFYYENKQEVDFIAPGKKIILWEAKYKITNENKKIKNYLDIAQSFGVKKFIFITFNAKKTEVVNQITVEYKPLWEILLNR